MQAYGNLFQGRENVSYTRGSHAFKAGVEVRMNRDTTYFGTQPNGDYDFGERSGILQRKHNDPLQQRHARCCSGTTAA